MRHTDVVGSEVLRLSSTSEGEGEGRSSTQNTWPLSNVWLNAFYKDNHPHQASLTLSTNPERSKQIEKAFVTFNEPWMNYWAAYIELQNQLYESVRAAREVSWLAATDLAKMSEINRVQRDLFAAMPRKMDYAPLGYISTGQESLSKLDQLDAALSAEMEKCKKLENAIEVLREQARKTKQELQGTGP